MSLAIGEVFAGYTILRSLGSGAMGEVYLAQHPRLPRRDALKVLHAHASGDSLYRDRFNREAELASALWNPHIVGVHDRGECNGRLWIAMDYVDGTDANHLVRDRYPRGLPQTDVVAIVSAVAEALDYAHQRGMLHRDVKPANILVGNPDGRHQRILLADFGIARQIESSDGLTGTNIMIGTVAYAAPEQLMGLAVDGRADQYALAATAFQLLTGTAPYLGDNPVAVISQHLNSPPPLVSQRRPDLAHLDMVLVKAMAKNAADRFNTCQEFSEALRAQIARRPVGVPAQPFHGPPVGAGMAPPMGAVGAGMRMPIVPAAAPKQNRRMIAVAAVAAVALLVAFVGIGGYLISRKHTGPGPEPEPAAVLDGTYAITSNLDHQTINGRPTDPDPVTTAWWAFRSTCGDNGCVATGIALDNTNHTTVDASRKTAELHFVDGSWHRTPTREYLTPNNCPSLANATTVNETLVHVWVLTPQANGSLSGSATSTAVGSECSRQGSVWQYPMSAQRRGDVPAGVTLADPAKVAPLADPATTPGPIATGLYRVDLDGAHQKVNGNVVPATQPFQPMWFGMQSECSSGNCVATLASVNSETNGTALRGNVLHLADGHWVMEHIVEERSCKEVDASKPDDRYMLDSSFTLDLQPDGSLTGMETMTVEPGSCRSSRLFQEIPATLKRISDLPPGLVLADPLLFLSS